MLYIEYHEYRDKYIIAQRKYDEVLSEKEHLFARTQPKATQYDKEVVSGGSPSNSFDEYLIAKEKKQIDESGVNLSLNCIDQYFDSQTFLACFYIEICHYLQSLLPRK